MVRAHRDDGKNNRLPEAHGRISLERRYSAEEFQRISDGLIPEEMEDKWFIFYEAPWLFMHRSWTGTCIFQVRFEERGEDVYLAEALVNTDREQYRATMEEAQDLLGRLLDQRAGRAE